MSIRKLFALSWVMLLALFSMTVVSAQDQPVNLRFTLWIAADSPQVALFNELAAEYTADHPNVTVTFESIPFADYQSVVTLQLAGSNPPDAGWIVEGAARSWVESGILTDLAPTLTSDEAYNFADFGTTALDLWREGDAQFGIPFSTSPFILLYNRDLFTEAGIPTPDELIESDEWTWENVAASAKAIADGTDSYGFQSNDAALYTGNFWATLIPILRAFGGDAWSADNTCQFNSPETVAGLQFIHDMIFADGSMVPPGTEVDFYAGNAGMTLGQLSRVNRLADAEFAWSIAPLPAGPAGAPAVIGQAAMVVFNNSQKRDAALDFVRFLTSEANVTRLAQFFPPARESVLSSQALVDANPLVPADLMQTAVIDAIQTGSVLPSHAEFPRIELAVRPLLDSLWTPDADVQAVSNSICDQIAPLLAR